MNSQSDIRFRAVAAVAAVVTGALSSTCWAWPQRETDDDLAAMADQLDAADRADFKDALGKASACTQARNFACTEAQLKKATRLAHGSADKRQLAAARQAMSAEQAQVADEARQRAELAEQERKLAEAEERLRVAEASAREAEADSQPSTASQLLQFGALMAQNYGANRAGAAAAAQAGKLPLADLSADRQRIADQRAKLAAAREQAEAARQASARTAPLAAPALPVAAAPATPPLARNSTAAPMPAQTLLAQASAAPATRTSSTGNSLSRSPSTGSATAASTGASADSTGLKLTTMPSTWGGAAPGNGASGTGGSVDIDKIVDPNVRAREERWQRMLVMPKTQTGRFQPLTSADEFRNEAQARTAARQAIAKGALESIAEGIKQTNDTHLLYQKLVNISPIRCRRWASFDAWECGVDVTIEVVADVETPMSTTSK